MTSTFSRAGAFSTFWYFMENWYHHLHNIKKALFSIKPPAPPPATNVLEINKPPGGGGASSMTARSNIDRTISQGSSDQNSPLGEPNRGDAKSSNVAILAASKLAARRLTKGLF